MAHSNRTPTGEYMDEGVREKEHEDSPELATDQGQKQLCKLPWEGKWPADGHTSPRRFPGRKQRCQHLDPSRKPDLCPSTPRSKPTWNWGPQTICCGCGPRQPSLPGNEKGGEGQQSSRRAMHVFVHTHKEKNEEIVLTQCDNYSHLLAAQPLVSYHFPLRAFLNRLQWAYAALGFIHERNLSWEKFRSHPERVHSATVRNTQTGCSRKG